MEQLRPRAAVEYQEMIRRIAMLAFLVTGLALPAPSAFAHGNQFICARVSIADDGQIALELTADYGDNPNIADAQAARQVLRDALRVRVGDEVLPLEHLGGLRFEDCHRYSDDSPVPSAAEPGPHRLVSAFWQTRLPDQRISFVAQEQTPLDVVMWRAGEQPSVGRSQWMLLIAGDQSPDFTLTSAAAVVPAGILAGAWALALLAVVPLLIWSRSIWLRRRPQVTTA